MRVGTVLAITAFTIAAILAAGLNPMVLFAFGAVLITARAATGFALIHYDAMGANAGVLHFGLPRTKRLRHHRLRSAAHRGFIVLRSTKNILAARLQHASAGLRKVLASVLMITFTAAALTAVYQIGFTVPYAISVTGALASLLIATTVAEVLAATLAAPKLAQMSFAAEHHVARDWQTGTVQVRPFSHQSDGAKTHTGHLDWLVTTYARTLGTILHRAPDRGPRTAPDIALHDGDYATAGTGTSRRTVVAVQRATTLQTAISDDFCVNAATDNGTSKDQAIAQKRLGYFPADVGVPATNLVPESRVMPPALVTVDSTGTARRDETIVDSNVISMIRASIEPITRPTSSTIINFDAYVLAHPRKQVTLAGARSVAEHRSKDDDGLITGRFGDTAHRGPEPIDLAKVTARRQSDALCQRTG